MVRALDRYVFGEFWKIFVTTALGFPILVNIIDLTDNLDKYLGQNLSVGRIALSYLYWLPDSMFMVLPAAVLFATVFSIGAFTRHSEITAAKASGISFYRFIAPIFVGAIIATHRGSHTRRASSDHQQEASGHSGGRISVNIGNDRYNFAYAADGGRVYKVGALHVLQPSIEGIVIERKGNGPELSFVRHHRRPAAQYRPAKGWVLQKGAMHVIPDSLHNMTFSVRLARRPPFHGAAEAADARAEGADRHGLPRAGTLHNVDGAVGRRGQRAARGADAEDRDSRHLHRDSIVRRAAGDEHAAWRRRLRNRT